MTSDPGPARFTVGAGVARPWWRARSLPSEHSRQGASSAVRTVARAFAALVLVAGGARAQQQGAGRPKAAQAIEIRGQVPTPQVVTVRPRQVPVFSRDVLTPAYFDRHFWDALLAPYEIAPDLSAAAGAVPIRLAVPALPADSGYRPPPADTAGRPIGAGGTLSPAPSSMPAPTSLSPAIGGDASRGSTPNAPREK